MYCMYQVQRVDTGIDSLVLVARLSCHSKSSDVRLIAGNGRRSSRSGTANEDLFLHGVFTADD